MAHGRERGCFDRPVPSAERTWFEGEKGKEGGLFPSSELPDAVKEEREIPSRIWSSHFSRGLLKKKPSRRQSAVSSVEGAGVHGVDEAEAKAIDHQAKAEQLTLMSVRSSFLRGLMSLTPSLSPSMDTADFPMWSQASSSSGSFLLQDPSKDRSSGLRTRSTQKGRMDSVRRVEGPPYREGLLFLCLLYVCHQRSGHRQGTCSGYGSDDLLHGYEGLWKGF